MGLVLNTNISKTEYLVDLENNGKAKQTALLSMSSTAPSGTFQKGSQYFNSTDKKIYTAVEDNVWGTTGKDPNFGIIYQCNNEYYVWDGDNLITTDLEGYEKLVNKATNFNTINNTKYPTTKAVADYVVKESIVRNFTDAGITKTTFSDVFSDRTNNTGLAEEILAKQFPTGTTLYGEVRNQGMPTGIGNAEIRVEILETKSNGAQVIEFTLFSVDIEPKEWSHIYFSARTEQQNPWVWISKAVPTDDYTSNATTTVPTSKALSDGLNSLKSFPTIVTDSNSSLPVDLSGYQEGDTFLNTTDKKIYKAGANSYELNSSSLSGTASVNYTTGVLSIGETSDYMGGYLLKSSKYIQWKGNIEINAHFKLNSAPVDDKRYVMFQSYTGYNSTPYTQRGFAVYVLNKKVYFCFYESGTSPKYINTEKLLFSLELDTNVEYFLNIIKNGTSMSADLFTGGYSGTKVATHTSTTEDYYIDALSTTAFYYSGGQPYNGGSASGVSGNSNCFTIGVIYLLDSYGETLKASSTLSWDSGTDLTDKTEYADKTNGKLYLYDGTTLLEITTTFVKIKGNATDNSSLSTALNNKQNKAIKFTNKSASNWVADNTYPDYGYKCEITNLNGVTSDSFAQVIFAQAEADSGNYATVCLTDFQKITIYSKVNDTITIPNIVVMGV